MKKNIIVKEVEKGRGVYIIEVDKKRASHIKGNTYAERVENAIKEFVKGNNQKFDSNIEIQPTQ